ncbi:MAG: hypothetical protein ACO1RX_17295 [Candidatus Sericytochromatia bacterium]
MHIVFYAINGVGLGHLTRQYAIARQLQRMLSVLNLPSDIRFITSSEAPQLTRDFPTYKLPSKQFFTMPSLRAFAAECKFIIANLLGAFRPDLLVMDTQPEGMFGEFTFIREYARQAVFINRHREQQNETHPVHLHLLNAYPLILVPDYADQQQDYPLPEEYQGTRRFIGPVTLWEKGATPQALRAHFGWGPDQPVAYVSAGGGGDPAAASQMGFLVDAMLERNYAVLAGYGPLYTGHKRYGGLVVPLTEAQISHWFSGVDLAISAAGYNTYQELLAARTPSLFFAQQKGLDRQERRIHKGCAQGWHGELAELTDASLDRSLARFQVEGAAWRAALDQRPRALGSVLGAYALLRQYADMTPARLHPGVADVLGAHFYWAYQHAKDPELCASWAYNCWLSVTPEAERLVYLEDAQAFLHHRPAPLLADFWLRWGGVIQAFSARGLPAQWGEEFKTLRALLQRVACLSQGSEQLAVFLQQELATANSELLQTLSEACAVWEERQQAS